MAHMGMILGESARQSTKLSPSAIQGVEMLTLPVADLASYVIKISEENPMLEVDFTHEIFDCDELRPFEGRDGLVFSRATDTAFENDFGRIADFQAVGMDLASVIRVQLPLSVAPAVLLDVVLESLDEDGYFRGDAWEIACECGCSVGEVEGLLDSVKRCDPAGVGASNAVECVRLQIEREEDDEKRDLALRIVADDLAGSMRSTPGSLARKYGSTRCAVVGALSLIRSCDPRPGLSFSHGSISYVRPDIEILEHEGVWDVRVLGSDGCPLKIDAEYLRLLDAGLLDEKSRQYMVEKKRAAQDTVRNLGYRGRVLYQLGLYLLRHQAQFFESRGRKVAPLSMEKAAADLGVHYTTVSRAVSSKTLATEFGTYPLSIFFARALACHAGDSSGSASASPQSAVSSYTVKERIRELVAGEDSAKPLSDQGITKILQATGIEVKRRTVTKYREALGIASSSERRMR